MRKINIVLFILLLTGIMQAQDRPQPKPGKAPTVNIKKPKTFVLPNGLKVMIVEDHKLPRISYSLNLDNAPFPEGNIKGVDELTSSLIGNGSKQTSKDAFNEEIDFLGASVNFSSSGAYASSLSKFANRILELMAEGALNPNFTQEEFDKEKAKMLEGLKAEEKSVPAIASRVGDALAFGKYHPSGEFVTETSLNAVTLADVEANYKNYFVPENAYLVVIGDIEYKKIKPIIERLFSPWEKGITPKATYAEPKNVDITQIDFVDMPNAVQSEIALVNTLNLKMSDADYFPAIMAAHILGGDFNSYLNMNLREANGWTYGARTSIGASKYANKIKSKSAVRNVVTDSAVVEFIKEIKRIRTEKVSDELLNDVKASFVGKFVMQVQQPQTVARFALKIETEKLPSTFYENYIKSINAVTPEQIQAAANKYFLIENTRIIIVGKEEDVLPGLKKLNIPIFYYDRNANPIDKSAVKKFAPAGVTAQAVLENYIKVIGGKTAVASVKTVSMLGSVVVPQAPSSFQFVDKVDSKGNSLINITMGGMSILKQLVNKSGAVTVQQGKYKKLEGAELIEMRASAVPFEELNLINNKKIELVGIVPIDGSEAYAVKNGSRVFYYDVKSGLKLADSRIQQQGGEKVTMMTYYKDYKVVKGVKFPFNIIQNVGFDLDIKITEVKVNSGVLDADFK